jgi:L-2-aminoadipate reductase
MGTMSALALCQTGKPKRFVFISSTSVLDTEHYVRLSDSILAKGGAGILESDDLQGSKSLLPTGYGQSKWVSEQLVVEAGRRGLRGAIVRPGYIVGDSTAGGTFILRRR